MSSIIAKKLNSVDRIEGEEDRGVLNYLRNAKHAYCQKPQEHDRTKNSADTGGTMLLKRKKADQDEDGDWDKKSVWHIGHFQPLNRAEHRDGRRNHPIAIK